MSVIASAGWAQTPFAADAKTANGQMDSRKQSEQLLRSARSAMKGNNLELAERFVSQADKLQVKSEGFLSRFADTPEKVRKDLAKMRQLGAAPNTRLKGLLGNQPDPSKGVPPQRLPQEAAETASALPTPNAAQAAAANFGTPQQRQNAALGMMAQAAAAFGRGDLVLAESLARQSDSLRIPEQAYAGGDTPWELMLKVTKQRRMMGIAPAAAQTAAGANAPAAGNVARAIYDPNTDRTYVQQASAQEAILPNNNALAQRVPGLSPLPEQPFPMQLQPTNAIQPAAPNSSVIVPSPVTTVPAPAATTAPGPTTYPAAPQYATEQFPTGATFAPTPAGNAPIPATNQTLPDVFNVGTEASSPGTVYSPEGTNFNNAYVPQSGSGQGMAPQELMKLGEQSILDGDYDDAREYFREAWAFGDSLDATTKQRLQEHLQLLRADSSNSKDDEEEEPDAEDLAEIAQIRRFIGDVSREQGAIARELATNPKSAWEKMKQLRARIDEADLPPEARKPLVARLDRAVAETEQYINANRAKIDLDQRNRDVLAAIDRERILKVENENKLAMMVDEFNTMMDQQRFAEAVILAKQARELAPHNTVSESMVWKSRFADRTHREMLMRERRDSMMEIGLDPYDPYTPESLDPQHPMTFPKKWDDLVRRRQGLVSDGRRFNDAERAIQRALGKKVQVQFDEAPLSEVIETLGRMTDVNVFLDMEGLSSEGVTSDTPVTINLTQEISLKSVLNLILSQHRLGYVIQDEVLRITSEQARDGDVYRETYYVGDLVIPIPNFLPGYNNGMAGALAQAHQALGYGPGGFAANRGNAPLVIADNDASQSINASALAQISSANMLQGSQNSQSPLGMGGATGADFDTLINLITSTVAPNSWDDVGGPGSMAPFEGNLSLVVSNTQDVHSEIVDLLEQLRSLQDLQVTIEVRFVTLQDNFFERIGVDFDFDVNDNSGFTQGDLVDPTSGFQEDGSDITIGLDPNGNPTLDLDLSFSQNSFASAVPAFGGFDPGSATSFGFAILSDIEAFFLVEAIQGDTRTNVMQAPKITMFNGQFANITDNSQRPFVTSVIPVVGDFAVAQQPVILVLAEGTQLSVQAVVSSDRRFVRLTMLPMFTQIGDVDTFTFEGRTTSTSQTINDQDPDDQVIDRDLIESETVGTTVQLPNFAQTSVSTTVSVPDGGTVLMGGIKRLAEGRTERGMPILGKLPYISRLFKNVGMGRETTTLMMMVTPRIIIQEEEEERVLGSSNP